MIKNPSKIHIESEISSQNSFTEPIEKEIKDAKVIDKPLYLVGSFEIWSMGITTVIGGQYYGWNANLTSGFGSYFIALFLMGTAYILLILSLAEIGSAFYFPGGCYGLARVVLGFYPGFIVGYIQLFEFIIYASSAMIYCSQVICEISNISKYYQPIFWVIFYGIALFFSIKNGKTMWTFINFLGVTSVLLIVIYCFGSLGWVNISRFGPFDDDKVHHVWFNGGMSEFLSSLASGTTAGFGGLESLDLIVSYMKDPLRNFQVGAISSALTLFFCNIMLLIVMASLPSGLSYTSQQEYPMNVGYNLIFQWPSAISSLLVIPANFAMGYGFFLPYGKLLQCLADSHLAPEFLGLKDETNPSKAILICSFFGFLLCIAGLFDPEISTHLNYIAILCGFISYFGILIGHITLLVKYKDIPRSFHSPFGIYGSIYAMIVFALGMIGSIGFLDDNHSTIIITSILILVLTICYYGMFAKTQKLSNEENKSLFKLHVINFNLRKKRGMNSKKPYSNQTNLKVNNSKNSNVSINNFQRAASKDNIINNNIVQDQIKIVSVNSYEDINAGIQI